MKDAIGQTIIVGDKVVHAGRYATQRVYEVLKVTAKRVQLPDSDGNLAGTYVDPDTVIVVTDNLERVQVAKGIAESVGEIRRDEYKSLGDWINR